MYGCMCSCMERNMLLKEEKERDREKLHNNKVVREVFPSEGHQKRVKARVELKPVLTKAKGFSAFVISAITSRQLQASTDHHVSLTLNTCCRKYIKEYSSYAKISIILMKTKPLWSLKLQLQTIWLEWDYSLVPCCILSIGSQLSSRCYSGKLKYHIAFHSSDISQFWNNSLFNRIIGTGTISLDHETIRTLLLHDINPATPSQSQPCLISNRVQSCVASWKAIEEVEGCLIGLENLSRWIF